MPNHYRFFYISSFAILTLVVVKITFGFFSSSASSTNNKFTAAAKFPTAIPTATPIPTATNTPTPTPTVGPGNVVINELAWAGSTKGSDDEWIELRNTTGHTIDISNWQLTKWVSGGTNAEALMLTIPASQSIGAGGLYLIAGKSPGAGTALLISPNRIDSSVVLSNSALQVRLFVSNWNSGGLLIDTAGNKSAPLAGIHDEGSPKKFYSMERNTTPGTGTLVTDWHTATTTSAGLDPDPSKGVDQNKGTPKATND